MLTGTRYVRRRPRLVTLSASTMTAPRQERNGGLRRSGALALLAAGLLLAATDLCVRAATSERVVADRHSGLAIGGSDPVAYFTDGAATPGSGEFEVRQGSAVWQFRNAANRDAFVARPDIYAPQFGGYDPVALARGVPFAGDPGLFLVLGQRLYLFGDAVSRDAFAADPAGVLRAARQRWPAVQETLAQ